MSALWPVDIWLSPSQVLAVYAMDIRDYYHAFKVSVERAVSNAMHGSLPANMCCYQYKIENDFW